jgi:hypothetical protein
VRLKPLPFRAALADYDAQVDQLATPLGWAEHGKQPDVAKFLRG